MGIVRTLRCARKRLFGQSQGVEIVIEPFSFHEGEVVALLDDASVVEYDDSVGSLNGAQPMRHDERRLAHH